MPGCDRPPSYTEAHHINEWAADGGRTDIADGILLCRHCHMLIHNNGWRISRTGARYFAVPPPAVDRERRPIPLPSKSPLSARC
ncbi:HNH endonuclease [Mycetocola manganoxydans]|uniref:HNH endonuclease n=2 Tax=Mycetocola manganoxydans TaxID=699879 RepID=A0A3L7A3V9_9MICO|nr:HNH endonuclease [Mycetocola manganoxydans]